MGARGVAETHDFSHWRSVPPPGYPGQDPAILDLCALCDPFACSMAMQRNSTFQSSANVTPAKFDVLDQCPS